MKINTFWKGLIAALIAFLASYFSENETIQWAYVAIYTVGYTIWYTAKNAVFPSVSVFGTIDLRDIISGIVLAIGSGVISYGAQYLLVGTVDYHELWITVWGPVAAYLGTKFGFGQKVSKTPAQA